MKNSLLKVCSLLLVLVMAIPLFASCGSTKKVSEDPKDAIADALDVATDAIKDSELYQLLESASNGGSVEFSMNLANILSAVTSTDIKIPLGVSLKGYAGGTEKAAFTAALKNGSTALVDATAFVTKKDLIFACDALLGKGKAYGIDISEVVEELEAMLEDVKDSVEESSAVGLEIMENIMANPEMLTGILKTYEELVESLTTAILSECNPVRTEKTVTIGDEKVDAVAFSTKVNGKTAKNIVKKVVDAFVDSYSKNKDIKELLKMLLSAEYGNDLTDDLFDQVWDQMPEQIEEGMEELYEALEKMPYSISVEVLINAKELNVMQSTAVIEGQGVSAKAVLTLGVDPVSPKYSAIAVSANGEEIAKVEYKVIEDTSKKFVAKVTTTVSGESIGVKLDYTRNTGAYVVSLTVPVQGLGDAGASVKGYYKLSSSEFTFSVDDISVSVLGQSIFQIKPELRLTVLAKDSMPKIPSNYGNLLDENVQADLTETVMSNVEQLKDYLPGDLLELLESLFAGSTDSTEWTSNWDWDDDEWDYEW